MRNVVSFDLEHWYSATLVRESVSDPEDRVAESVDIVRDVLRAHDVTATFFAVGELIRERPDLAASLADEGHEIASHGHTHTPLFDLSPDEFRRELAGSADAIEDATGERPVGFRAPNFSVTERTAWAFDALVDQGYWYDSSVFPVRTPMYGVRGAPVRPHQIDPKNPFANGRAVHYEGGRGDVERRSDDRSLLELPPAVFHPRFRLPIAGGFYARLLPTWVLKRGIRTLNARGIPAMLYFHPWEFNPKVATDALPPHARFVSYHGIESTAEKLDGLLASFEFGSVPESITRSL
ncbi:polysaccharide deacetylase family protein [Haladaptatus halobius]|uniref:polysaccharide deacetylase family protein n=1 Tax=Haladaptatus halobius TaxID=2884875 RepID=UPI001D0A5FE2|nr:polysaccharide deacetylase family protein [Haladaptatus halobius]